MKKKTTGELMNALQSSKDVNQYFTENKQCLISGSLADYLSKLIEDKHLTKSAVIKKAEMNEIYGYQIFSGIRVPSRNKLIALCVGMRLNIEETQQTLKFAGFAPLYPKSKRDSIIIKGIETCQDVYKINTALYDWKEPTL